MARTADAKWLWRSDQGITESYDLRADPHERTNVVAPDFLARGQTALRPYLARNGTATIDPAADPTKDPATADRLRALGYLE
jgi:hypothetical protein